MDEESPRRASTSVWFCHALGGGVRVAEPSRVSSEKETPTKKDTTMTFREQLTSQERATSVVSAQTRLSRPALAVYPSSCAGPLLEDPQSPGQRGTRAWRRTPGFGAPLAEQRGPWHGTQCRAPYQAARRVTRRPRKGARVAFYASPLGRPLDIPPPLTMAAPGAQNWGQAADGTVRVRHVPGGQSERPMKLC
ncbi:hypothetical protein ACCO45_006195 [Purpureocillium lilacinum]|uniref:Uncharacterized protein n=1 Tax=Purpureocillium lilacinum TaxID=33203 RepID=A0ACC4DYC8_PURLI